MAKKRPAKKDNQPVPETKKPQSITDHPIVQEMETSYLDYAMSVIVARALPDVRDGLKPVHRRILYAMWQMGLRPSARYKKSAAVVGEVLGKYHPHGDTAVYDSMVRMAQDFALRYPLVHGQGNFGSMDGDRAAAMRYTEAKLYNISEELLIDIEKETIKWTPNYDNSHKEPVVLPAKLPNLLLNGAMGIAVGMATNIPPHNLQEITSAILHLIKNPDASVDDLMTHVTGPDFPTGGIIYDIKEIKAAYATGKGRVVMRGEAEITEIKNNQFQIVITSIPYQVNKATMIERMAELVRDKKLEGIKDLRDESNKEGVRVVIDLKKDAYPKKILNNLYKHTQLQDSFHVNMLALVDGIQPRVLTLKIALEEYLKYRKDVIRRRTQFDLDKAKDREHILMGLKIALDKIDAVIKTIKASKDKEVAKTNLMKKFKLSERQAIAILEMRLQNLANLERLKIDTELKEKRALIKALESILSSPKKIMEVINQEVKELGEKFGDQRRTKVIKSAVGEMSSEDLIPNEPAVVTITHDGYIKRMSPDTFKAQSRGGKGVMGMTTKEEDDVEHFFSTNTHTDLMFFTTRGRVFQLKTYEIPPASRTAKGQNIVNFLQLGPEEKVSSVLPGEDFSSYKYFVMVTKRGLMKKIDIEKIAKVRRSGLIALKLKEDDTLEWVKMSSGTDDVVLVTKQGQAIRFKEKMLRSMGRNAAGVKGIRLKSADEIIGLDIVTGGKASPSEQLLTVMANGFGKKTKLSEYKVQGRGGSGVKTAHITTKTGPISAAMVVDGKREKEDLIIISSKGQVIRLPIGSVNTSGRATQGVRLMRFKDSKDEVANVVLI
jgi:DNA gyrase subunit A